MKIRTLIVSAFFAASFALPSFAQDQPNYKIAAIQGAYMIIGQKPYKILSDCSSFQAGDIVTFSEDPITCEKVTAIDIDTFNKCELECLENLGTPDPIDNPPGPDAN